MKKLLLILILLPCLAGCRHTAPLTGSSTELCFDRNEVWQLVKIQNKEIHYTNDRQAIILQFNPEAKGISGFSGCNNYFGQYKCDNTSIFFTDLGSTRMACPDAQMTLENKFLPLLEKVNRYELTRYTLTLYQNERILLVFEKN